MPSWIDKLRQIFRANKESNKRLNHPDLIKNALLGCQL